MLKRYLIIIDILLVIVLGGTFALLRVKKTVATPLRASESNVEVVRDCTFNEQTMLDDINSVRTHKLVVDPYLEQVADKRIVTVPYDLDNHAGFNVLATDGSLTMYKLVGEILASNQCASTKQIFSQWQNSPGHWAIITNESMDVLGIGFNGQSAVVIFGDLR